jgi:hypothetical protein
MAEAWYGYIKPRRATPIETYEPVKLRRKGLILARFLPIIQNASNYLT